MFGESTDESASGAALPKGDNRILSVSDVNASVRLLLEERFPLLWIEGEISNFHRPRSGHWYFTLKDDRAQLRCAMFANRNRRVKTPPQEGDQVVIRCNLSLYPNRGDYQAIVEHMQPAGAGALQAAYDKLRARLAAEGLFDDARKRDFLEYPEHIAVISSATGAAVQDVLAVLQRRYPVARVTVVPTLVQGPDAEVAVLRAFDRTANLDADVVILTRGGGSLEDLWTFNLESVVRAVADCPSPVISAIGHETDVTLCDFAADLRAPTPSVAAEVATPDAADLLRSLAGVRRELNTLITRQLTSGAQRVAATHARLRDPRRTLQLQQQRGDELEARLRREFGVSLSQRRLRVQTARQRLRAQAPARQIARHRERLDALRARLVTANNHAQGARRARFRGLLQALNGLNPLGNLERGQGIVMRDTGDGGWGTALASAADAPPGTKLLAHLVDGTLACTVDESRPSPARN
ncbi:MAG: exodeoxyribonuclease VII large subunit [Pseudomonadota bacterium]